MICSHPDGCIAVLDHELEWCAWCGALRLNDEKTWTIPTMAAMLRDVELVAIIRGQRITLPPVKDNRGSPAR